MTDDQIHWFSIINSLMIVLFLSGMVAMIMMRTLHRDISKYNQLETAEEAQEETGWKLVCIPSFMHLDSQSTETHVDQPSSC
jgi:transmembrane 9 superfamily protein 2/4